MGTDNSGGITQLLVITIIPFIFQSYLYYINLCIFINFPIAFDLDHQKLSIKPKCVMWLSNYGGSKRSILLFI